MATASLTPLSSVSSVYTGPVTKYSCGRIKYNDKTYEVFAVFKATSSEVSLAEPLQQDIRMVVKNSLESYQVHKSAMSSPVPINPERISFVHSSASFVIEDSSDPAGKLSVNAVDVQRAFCKPSRKVPKRQTLLDTLQKIDRAANVVSSGVLPTVEDGLEGIQAKISANILSVSTSS